MEWIQYAIFFGLAVLIIKRLLPVKGLHNVKPDELTALMQNRKDTIFVDVREPSEYKNGHIVGFRNIPLSVFGSKLNELDPNKQIVLTCQSGVRSRQAAKLLLKKGFSKVSHLPAGFSSWNGKVSRS